MRSAAAKEFVDARLKHMVTGTRKGGKPSTVSQQLPMVGPIAFQTRSCSWWIFEPP
jgi:hypothetical protein